MSKLDVLIVDDEPINIDIISKILKDQYNIKIALDGQSGYEAYKKHKPSIIISDIQMPIMNGIEMAKKIREDDLNTKIIFITSHDDIDYLVESNSLRLTKYIFKPIEAEVLLYSLKSAKEELEKYQIHNTKILHLNEEFVWDYESCSLSNKNDEVNLSPTERKILNFLFHNLNSVKTYDDIIYEISDGLDITSKKSLLTIMTNLRKKLPENTIENIYATGYKISLHS